MAQQDLILGASDNDGNGEGLRDGMIKVQANFDELYDKKTGFIDYNDTTGSISIVQDVWTDIPNDGLGVSSNDTYAPVGVSQLLDVTTGYIDATELKLGDVLLIRNDFSFTPSTNNIGLSFRYELGDGAGIYTLENRLPRLDEGAGVSYRHCLLTHKIYMGDTNTLDNPIKIQIKSSGNGALVNNGTVITALIR